MLRFVESEIEGSLIACANPNTESAYTKPVHQSQSDLSEHPTLLDDDDKMGWCSHGVSVWKLPSTRLSATDINGKGNATITTFQIPNKNEIIIGSCIINQLIIRHTKYG